MPGANIYDAAAKHAAQLAAGEADAADRMLRAFGRAWQSTRQELEAVMAKLEQARAAGVEISPAWLYQQRRLNNVLADLEGGMRQFARQADIAVQDAQRDAVAAAEDHAHELLELGLEETAPGIDTSFTRLQRDTLDQLVGNLADGSPLSELLDTLPGDAGSRLEQAVVDGVAKGRSARQIVSSARDALGGTLSRALTIARTEVNRAHREATRLSYEANTAVVAGWTWTAALDRRTCAVCWAMHGTKHPVSDRLDGHPNCRCAMIPVTRSWEHLGAQGVDETRLELEDGADAFARLPENDQLAVLGRKKLDAYQRGDLSLGDLVGRDEHPRWGSMRRERSVADAQRARAAGQLHHLGRGLDDGPVRELPNRAARPRRGGAHDELAGRLGIDPDQLPGLRAELKEVRAAARAEAAQVQKDALYKLQITGVPSIKSPPPARWVVDPETGRRRLMRVGGHHGAGEYDWMEQLSDGEKRRLTRNGWMTPREGRSGADALVDLYDGGVDEWLDLNRRSDAAGAIARGKMPAMDAYGSMPISNVAPNVTNEGYRLGDLFAGDDEQALGHVLEVRDLQVDEAATRAARDAALAPPPSGGLTPDMLSTEDWHAELQGLLDRADAGEVLTLEDIERMDELLPPEVADLAGEVSADELHELAADVYRRRRAGEQF